MATNLVQMDHPKMAGTRPTSDLLADEARLAILAELRWGEAGVTEIADALGLSPIVVCRSLAFLKEAGLVWVRANPRDHRRHLYRLDFHAPWAILGEMASLLGLEFHPLREPASSAVESMDQVKLVAPASGCPLSLLSFFSGTNPADADGVTVTAEERTFSKREMILFEGNASPGLCVIKSGQAKIFKTSLGGKEQILQILGPGQAFNEVPAFSGGSCPAGAEALEPTTIYYVPRGELQRLLTRSPSFAMAVVRAMAHQVRHLNTLLEDLCFRSVTARVAKILLQTIKPEDGVGAGADKRRRLTQQEMALLAGTAREVVARALKTLERAGAIRQCRGRITILDTARLSRATSW